MNRNPATPPPGPWTHRLLVYAFSVLLELQRLTLQKSMVSSAEEQQALVESQKLFLANQTRYQQINEQIANLSEQLRELERRQRDAQRVVDTRREPVQREYQARYSRHQWKLAALKLAVLIKVGMVMQEHFPKRYFKYVLIGVALLLVAGVLVYLLRLRAYPKRDWLLKQSREAYEHFLCPACGTVLFEECASCHAVRHALLPTCTKCGATRELETAVCQPAGPL